MQAYVVDGGKVFARCHFTDDYVQLLRYLGNGYYAVRYPQGDTQEAHESSLDFEYNSRSAV